MSFRTRFKFTPDPVTSMPSTRTVPRVGSSRRVMQRSSVLLPDPDGPITMITSPGRTRRFSPLRTSRSPNDLWRSSISSMERSPAMTPDGIASLALRGVRRRVVPLESWWTVTGVDRRQRGILGRRLLEPLLVVLHQPAVQLRALDRLLHLIAEGDALQPQCVAEVPAGVFGEPDFDLRVLSRRVVGSRDLVEGGEGAAGDHRLAGGANDERRDAEISPDVDRLVGRMVLGLGHD